MTSERSKRRDFLSLIFISKSISKKLLIKIFVNIEIKRQRRPFSFILTKIFETSFEGGPLWLVWLFGRSDQNVPFNLTKLLSSVLLFCILLTRTITKCPVAWVGSVQAECRRSTWHMKFLKFQTKFLLNGKHPLCTIMYMYQSRPIHLQREFRWYPARSLYSLVSLAAVFVLSHNEHAVAWHE